MKARLMGRLMFFSRVKPKTVLKMNFNTTTFCLAFALFWFTSLWTCGRSVPLQGNSLGILAPGYTSGNLGWISPFGNPPANPSVPAYPVNGGGLYGYPSTAMDNANYRSGPYQQQNYPAFQANPGFGSSLAQSPLNAFYDGSSSYNSWTPHSGAIVKVVDNRLRVKNTEDAFDRRVNSSGKNCHPEVWKPEEGVPGKGHCIVRYHLKLKCKTLSVSYSPECPGKELCCFAKTTALTTTSPSTTSIPAFTTVIAVDSTSVPLTERFCVPDLDPSRYVNSTMPDGICVSQENFTHRCTGMLASTTTNCLYGEACCYPAQRPITTTVRSTTTTTVQTTKTTDTTTKKMTAPPTTKTTTTPIPGSCRPGSDDKITSGTCMATAEIIRECKGSQISLSVDCKKNEYCCFLDPSDGKLIDLNLANSDFGQNQNPGDMFGFPSQ